MITQLDIVCEQEACTYIVGGCDVMEIKEAEYSVCGDPFPCYVVVHKSGMEVEIRTVHICNISRVNKEEV